MPQVRVIVVTTRKAGGDEGRRVEGGLGDAQHRRVGQLARRIEAGVAEAGDDHGVMAAGRRPGAAARPRRRHRRPRRNGSRSTPARSWAGSPPPRVPGAATARADSTMPAVIAAEVLGLMSSSFMVSTEFEMVRRACKTCIVAHAAGLLQQLASAAPANAVRDDPWHVTCGTRCLRPGRPLHPNPNWSHDEASVPSLRARRRCWPPHCWPAEAPPHRKRCCASP